MQIDGKAKALTQHGTLPGSGWGPQDACSPSLLPPEMERVIVEFGLTAFESRAAPPTGATSMASSTSWFTSLLLEVLKN